MEYSGNPNMPNRVAFITGASRGIGRAIALTLSRAGHDVVIASFEVEKNQEVAAEVQALGGKALPVDLNLTSQDSIKQGIAQASKEFGKIDILVNNAGIARDALSMRMKPQDWDMVLQINLSGSFFAAQQVIPQMMRERWGRIVNIASVVGQRAMRARPTMSPPRLASSGSPRLWRSNWAAGTLL